MFSLFKKHITIEYPNALPSKVHQLLENYDEKLVEANTSPSGELLKVYAFVIPFEIQHRSLSSLTTLGELAMKQENVYGKRYIPRTVAVTIGVGGEWIFFYGIRGDEESTDIEKHLFIHALNQTNNMRANYEESKNA